MMRRYACLVAMAATLVACNTSPEPDYFALAPAPGPVVADVDYVVKIRRPSLANYLDRPDFVGQGGDYGVQIDDGRRWAEPLDTMFERILLQDLQQRLPSARLFSEDSGMSVTPRATVAFDIQQFNKTADGKIVLEGQLNVNDVGAHLQPPLQHVSYAVDADSSIAGNMSALIGKLADDIAVLLRAQKVRSNKAAAKPSTAGE